MVRVIVVDDDKDFGYLMQERLRSAGMFVTFHRGPFGTLMAIGELPYDLVILDVNMPGLDGSQIVRLMRDTRGLRPLKVLLCSSMDVDRLRQLAQEIGVHGYISKSASKQEFLDKVRELVA